MPLYIRHSCCVKIPKFQPKLTPFYTSPPPLFNTLSNPPKPSNPLFYKPFHRPHKIILTFYSRHPSFPHFVAQKRGTPLSVTIRFPLFFYLQKRGNEFISLTFFEFFAYVFFLLNLHFHPYQIFFHIYLHM